MIEPINQFYPYKYHKLFKVTEFDCSYQFRGGIIIVSEKYKGYTNKKIKDVMESPIIVSPDTTKKELFDIAKDNPNTKVFIVADQNKKFLGDIHENDLFLMAVPNDLFSEIGIDLALDLQRKFFAKDASEIMRKHDYCCDEEDSIIETALEFIRIEPSEMPVLNKEGIVVGVVTEGILLRHLDAK
jgi:CBS domain-containing protein